MSDGNFLEAALRYAELGYRVFPCVPRGKVPLTEHGFHDATVDPEQIERWWQQYPDANIGIATAGLVVIDIDGDANPWLTDQPEKLLELASGAVALTPRGGSHRVFRQPDGKNWRCTESRLAPKVDTRAAGGYIVAAPSALPEGSYVWAPGMELASSVEDLAEPPGWLAEQLDALANGKLVATNGTQATARVSEPSQANLIPEGQRNATLARLAGNMRRVGMSQAEIAVALLQVNADRCDPALPTEEVQRIATSVARYQPDAVSVALIEDHWDQMHAEPAAKADGDNPDPGPIPSHLLRVPGFIDEVMNYTLDTSPYPEPTLAFAGALALQALLAGRKVRDEADNRTNLYLLALANSGAGKDHPRKVNQRILVEAGLADSLGTSFASGEGLEDRLFEQPASLFQVDEVDGLLLRVNQAKDGRHEQIISILLQMYSSANGVYVMRAKAGRERTVIDQPCLCLLGTAVPKHFYEAISARMMTNGFLARMLILECHKRGQGRDATVGPLPAGIVETARWWANFQPGGKPGNLSDLHPEPRVVPQSAEARAVLRLLRERADSEYTRCEERNDAVAMAIWARAFEKAKRLALVYACSAAPTEPCITQQAAEWASAFVEHQTRRMLFMAGCHTFENDFDAKRKRLLDVLVKWRDKHGDRWMPFWMISRKLPWTSREHEEVRDTLASQRLVETRINQTGGRPGAVYRLTSTMEAVSASASGGTEPAESTS